MAGIEDDAQDLDFSGRSRFATDAAAIVPVYATTTSGRKTDDFAVVRPGPNRTFGGF